MAPRPAAFVVSVSVIAAAFALVLKTFKVNHLKRFQIA